MKKLVAILLILVLCMSACTYAEEIWTCPKCGEENGEDCAICENCGAKHAVEWICPACGRTNAKNFCGGCGAKNPSVIEVGDTVTFGTWGGEDIEWQVLEKKDDGTYVLLSVYGLDAKPYNTDDTAVTWETCTLRAWLNGEFYETAFSASEKGKIVLSTVENPDNKEYGTKGGNTTKDYVYLLSFDEVSRYFHMDPYADKEVDRGSEALICMPTQTALNNGAYIISQADVDQYQPDYSYPLKADACWWWLRSPGVDQLRAAGVYGDGYVDSDGYVVSRASECLRPAVCTRF